MIEWVESQSVLESACLVFGFCYILAAAVFILAILAAATRAAPAFKATTPTMLTPLAVITGLLIAFLAGRVWTNLDRAIGIVTQEASAIRETLVLADALPVAARGTLRASIRDYLDFVLVEDFPAMMRNEASPQQPANISEALHTMLAFGPADLGQQVIQQRAVASIERVMEARRSRIVLSKSAISPIQWIVIVFLDTLILLTIAMVHLDRRATVAINLFMFSTAIAACLVLLMANDRPYTAGGFTVQPTALREISAD